MSWNGGVSDRFQSMRTSGPLADHPAHRQRELLPWNWHAPTAERAVNGCPGPSTPVSPNKASRALAVSKESSGANNQATYALAQALNVDRASVSAEHGLVYISDNSVENIGFENRCVKSSCVSVLATD